MLLDKQVADFIIYLIKSHKENTSLSKNDLSEFSIKGSAKYLLRQTIRQINIPHSNMYVSEKALNLWKSITDDNIKQKCYNDNVKCKLEEWIHKKYVGAKKSAEIVKTCKGQFFKFNDVFLDEHIIPVEIIIRELLCLDTDSPDIYNQIDLTIKKLAVCKILKEENPSTKFNRSSDLETVLQSDYANIKVYNFNQIDEHGNII